jgi:ribosomal protein S12
MKSTSAVGAGEALRDNGKQKKKNKQTNFLAFSPQEKYAVRELLRMTKLLPNVACRGCNMVSETDLYDR